MPKIVRLLQVAKYGPIGPRAFWFDLFTGELMTWFEGGVSGSAEESMRGGLKYPAQEGHAADCGTTLADIRKELESGE
jgi:hypothetical protein